MLNKLLRLYHTVKYLKIRQIIWRGIGLTPKLVKESKTYPSPVENLENLQLITRNGITKDYNEFTFLSERHLLSESGWDNSSISKLWRYNLHYFEYLLQPTTSSETLIQQIHIINKWITFNPFGRGTAWEPYPTSLRIINWIKWHSMTNQLPEAAKANLWNQLIWLSARPEYHLLGNHLFINAKAMLFASAFFQLGEESKIYRKAISILEKELVEQFLDDGAHFELSPMYHSLAMEDLLDLISISSLLPASFPQSILKSKFIKGMNWLSAMSYENEELSHFNDSANKIAPKFSELKNFASRLGISLTDSLEEEITYYKNSGFIVYKDLKSHLIADIGNIGPDYLPGHAHADSLSFELSLRGARMIVNSGTSIYGNSSERLRQRGTSAHSTVEIDNENSSEIWSGFRVARRAKTFNIRFSKTDSSNEEFCFGASHNGYERLNMAPIHHRNWALIGNKWIISDTISGKNNLITSRYYIHPDIQIEKFEEGYTLSKNEIKLANVSVYNDQNAQIINTTYHDEFGISKSNKCIVVNSVSPCNIKIVIELL